MNLLATLAVTTPLVIVATLAYGLVDEFRHRRRSTRRESRYRLEDHVDQYLLNPQTVTHNAQREAFR